MDAPHLLARHGEHAERIVVAQVLFDREWEAAQVGQLVEIGRMHARRVEAAAVVRDVGVGVLQGGAHALELQRL